MLNSVDLPAPFGPITPTMPPGGSLKEVVDQQIVAVAFLQMVEVDHVLAETFRDGMVICATVFCLAFAILSSSS